MLWLILLSFWISGQARAEFETADFERTYQHFRSDPDYQSDTPAHDNVRFIFVSGLKGEDDPSYFINTASELRRLTHTSGETELKKMKVFIVKPSSQYDMQEGEQFLDERIKNIVAASPPGTRFRIIGHSLGGFRLFDYLNKHPEFAAKVEAAVYVQTPFGGSPLAQFILDGRKITEVIPLKSNPIQAVALYGLSKFFSWYKPSLRILSPLSASRHIEAIMQATPVADQLALTDKSLMFTTHKAPYGGLRIALPGSATILNICGKALAKLKPGPNDGLVHVADQRPPGFAERSVEFSGLNHRALSGFSAEGVPFARALYSLPVSGQ